MSEKKVLRSILHPENKLSLCHLLMQRLHPWRLLSPKRKERCFVFCWMWSDERKVQMMSLTQLDSLKPWIFAAQDFTLSSSHTYFFLISLSVYLLSHENILIIKSLHLIFFCFGLLTREVNLKHYFKSYDT